MISPEDYNLSLKEKKSIYWVIYTCLKSFSETGGNNVNIHRGGSRDEDWDPDEWVNVDTDEMKEELEVVSDLAKYLDAEEIFASYGLKLSVLEPEEVIVEIYTLLGSIRPGIVKNFYNKRPARLKDLENKLGVYSKSKKFGL